MVGQGAAVDGHGEYLGRHARLYAQWGVFHNDAFPWLQVPDLSQSYLVGFGVGLAVGHVIGRDDVVFGHVVSEVLQQPVYQRSLSAAGHHGHAPFALYDARHQLFSSVEDLGLGHLVKQLRLHVIHALGFLQRDVLSLLFLHEPYDGVYASGSLGGVGVSLRHVDAEAGHALSPGDGVMGHAVIEHAVHIEKHGLGAELPKAVAC